MIFFSELEQITGGKLLTCYTDVPLVNIITDSRKAIYREGSIFFAIHGERHDGHKYIEELYRGGIRLFVVEKEVPIASYPEGSFLKVPNTLVALQRIAAKHRRNFNLPVVAITGSNGKTIIKEWLYQLLSPDFNVAKNPGSYNSQLGVPLSVWQLQEYHTLGIFEAGISKAGEMATLEEIIKPTIGIFTNIGSAHSEGFESTDQKIEEKLILFKNVQQLIYCADHSLVHQAVQKKKIPSLTWGNSPMADIRVEKKSNHYSLTHNNQQFSVVFPFTDNASVENALHAIALMLYLKTDPAIISQRIKMLQAVPMRLELKEGINYCQVIDDTYNNDLAGLQISLDFLNNQLLKQQKTIILSDMLESGLEDDMLTEQIARLINNSGAQKFIGIGSVLQKYASKIKVPNAHFYNSTESFLGHFQLQQFSHEIILVKGARAFQFEKIVAQLQRKVHGTVMEVNLGALVHNLNYFRNKLNPSTKLMVMVKAFAYGSDSVQVANVLQYHRVDYLGVAYADEGVELRKHNITLPIMVMNPSPEGFTSMIRYNLEPELYGFKIFKELISFLDGRPCRVHLKIDTGMHRLGFDKEDISELIELLHANTNLEIASIFTHLAGSDEAAHDQFSREQAKEFDESATALEQALKYKPIRHILNTPGILRFPELQMDMVRLGVGLYGVDPTASKQLVKPVATLKTVVSQLKKIKPGESVGYGRWGKAINEMTIATIAIGYADGYSRAFSKGVGEVYISGSRAKVIGNVCMDMTMIDVTGVDVKEGDEVIIFGEQLPIQEVARMINTIPYEILTNTSERVKRVFIAESI